jgi:phage terminase large subunit
MKKTIKEQVQGFYPKKVRICRKIAAVDGMNMVRMMFPNMWFDEDKCDDGLNALRHFRYKVEMEANSGHKGQLSKDPVHDWASHAAAALRYMAVTMRDTAFDRSEEEILKPWDKIGNMIGQKWHDIAPGLGWLGQ